jgi:hypothetical protein
LRLFSEKERERERKREREKEMEAGCYDEVSEV